MPQPMDNAAGREATPAFSATIGQRQARVFPMGIDRGDGELLCFISHCVYCFPIPIYFYIILTVCCQVSLQSHELLGMSTLARNYMLRLRRRKAAIGSTSSRRSLVPKSEYAYIDVPI
jgi:hypothetical protein